MPFPVLAGVPWLAGVLGSAFGALFTFFATYITKRFAIVAAAIVIIAALTATLFATLEALAAGLSLYLPPQYLVMVDHFLPDNAMACVTAYLTARIARWVYAWNIRLVQYKLL